jgi:hypothetical protein
MAEHLLQPDDNCIFVVGYAGFEGLIRLFGVPIDQSANTDAAGNITGA